MPPAPAGAFDATRRQAWARIEARDWAGAEALLRGLSGDARFGDDDRLALATAQFHLGDVEAAADTAGRLLARDPAHARAAHVATSALMAQNRWAEALRVFESQQGGPAQQHYHFVIHHGVTLAALGRPRDAVDRYLHAMTLEMGDPVVHMKLAVALRDLRLYEEAAESFETAHILDPRRITARLMALHMRQHACRWQGFEPARRAIVDAFAGAQDGDDALLAEGGVFTLAAVEHPPALFRQATAQAAARHRRGTPLRRRAVRPAGERLRVGYVSNDFHNHATAVLMVEMLEQRDRDRFEVTLYSHSRHDGSPIQHRIRAACERFVDISPLSNQAAAQRIHADGIDVLVDLKGHTAESRLGIFAFRPAPVQATWLGFPGTSGADYVDYVIGDRWVTPLDHADRYTERIAQLPGSYQPNDGRRERPAPTTRREAGLPEYRLVLASFNQAYKLTPETFDAWMRILRAEPRSLLWLLEDNPQASRNLLREAEARGVDPARIVFAPRLPLARHLARLPLADLVLDNWPCNAHTTASDALWMGVPLLTLMGEAFASRVAASLLHGVGLDELVCTSPDQYVATAIALLGDPGRLARLRAHLEAGRTTFPLFDGRRFAADLERLYLRMADRDRRGLPPAALEAEPITPA